jgi:hypothetical protein
MRGAFGNYWREMRHPVPNLWPVIIGMLAFNLLAASVVAFLDRKFRKPPK